MCDGACPVQGTMWTLTACLSLHKLCIAVCSMLIRVTTVIFMLLLLVIISSVSFQHFFHHNIIESLIAKECSEVKIFKNVIITLDSITL